MLPSPSPSPRSPPSSKVSPLCVLASPVLRAERCKPCPVALAPTLDYSASRSQPLDPLKYASRFDLSICFHVEVKTVLILSDTSSYPAKPTRRFNSTTHRRFRSCLDERAPARRESTGLSLSAPIPTHPRRDLWSMGWILAPNGIGFKKCAVWSFRVRGDTHSLTV